MLSLIILFNSCLVGRRWPGASNEYLNVGRRSIEIPTDYGRQVASENQ